MYGQQYQLPPEVIESMLRLSGSKEERDELKEQLALSNMLTKMGMESNSRAPSHPVGGAANAIAQGLQGYAGGKMRLENMEALKLLRGQNIGDRRNYLQGALGGGSPNRLLDREQYGDPEDLFGG